MTHSSEDNRLCLQRSQIFDFDMMIVALHLHVDLHPEICQVLHVGELVSAVVEKMPYLPLDLATNNAQGMLAERDIASSLDCRILILVLLFQNNDSAVPGLSVWEPVWQPVV